MKKNIIWLLVAAVVLIGGVYWYMNQNQEKSKIVNVVALLPLTGAASANGNYIKNGLDLAISNTNISITYLDSKSMPKDGINALQMELNKNRKIDYFISAVSSVAKATSPIIEKNKILNFGIAIAYPDFTKSSEYNYRVYPNAINMTTEVINYINNTKKYKKVGLFYVNDEFGLSTKDVFNGELKEKVVLNYSFEVMQNDFKNSIAKINEKNIEALYISGYGPAYMALLKQLKQLNFKGEIICDMTLGVQSNKNVANELFENGIVYVDGNINKEYINNFNIKYNEKPSSFSGYANDIILLINKLEIYKDHKKSVLDTIAIKGVMGDFNFENQEAKLKFSIQNTK